MDAHSRGPINPETTSKVRSALRWLWAVAVPVVIGFAVYIWMFVTGAQLLPVDEASYKPIHYAMFFGMNFVAAFCSQGVMSMDRFRPRRTPILIGFLVVVVAGLAVLAMHYGYSVDPHGVAIDAGFLITLIGGAALGAWIAVREQRKIPMPEGPRGPESH